MKTTHNTHRDESDVEKNIKDLLEEKRPKIRSKVDQDSLPDLFYHEGSVKHAADSEIEESLSRLSLHALILSFSMNHINGTTLPDDIRNLIRQNVVESDLHHIYT